MIQVQIAKLANTPVTISAEPDKPFTKSKKKSSPLDDIRKDLDALYALLKLKWKEEGLLIMIQKMNCPLKHLLQITHTTFTIRNCLVMMKKTILI